MEKETRTVGKRRKELQIKMKEEMSDNLSEYIVQFSKLILNNGKEQGERSSIEKIAKSKEKE